MLNRFARFSLAISEIDRCWHKLAAEEMAKYELNSPHAVYLTALYTFKEGVTAAKLGELCCKNKADVSRMVSIMEQKGLVTRESVSNNLYRGLLKLTGVGMEAAEFVCRRVKVAVDLASAGLDADRRKHLYDSLELISGNLRRISAEGLPESVDTEGAPV